MRLLVDAQLPPALARWLGERGHEATHVLDEGLLEAGDKQIWEHATRLGAGIVTKDEDFVHLHTLHPEGPVVIWVRLGNTTRRELLAGFSGFLPSIEAALAAGERLIELLPDAGGGPATGR